MNAKRKRIFPIHTKTVEARIKYVADQLGYDKAQLKWQAIVNEVRSTNLQTSY